ncbi:MAG: sugar phosphate isomerase/epimerase [Verrucomicrobia bacterium]|nr:sugar phosphate isomerase/epimerase [Verrucomicrobiota bacterium]
MSTYPSPVSRRAFVSSTLTLGASALAVRTVGAADTPAAGPAEAVLPPAGKRLLLSCKLGMIADKAGDRKLGVAERLQMAAEAGFDGVDFDDAGSYTPAQAREAVRASGVFVHNAINHAHWEVRLTDPRPETRAKARANLEHCLRVSHAAGGSGVLIVVGRGRTARPRRSRRVVGQRFVRACPWRRRSDR